MDNILAILSIICFVITILFAAGGEYEIASFFMAGSLLSLCMAIVVQIRNGRK